MTVPVHRRGVKGGLYGVLPTLFEVYQVFGSCMSEVYIQSRDLALGPQQRVSRVSRHRSRSSTQPLRPSTRTVLLVRLFLCTMEDSLYDTSWLVHRIPRMTPSFAALLDPPAPTHHEHTKQSERLSIHAGAFRESLGKDRPRYEADEEKEKVGGLRQCRWRRLEEGIVSAGDDNDQHRRSDEQHMVGKKRKRGRQDGADSLVQGLLISLVYEKTTYKFVVYTHSGSGGASKRGRRATTLSTKPSSSASSSSGQANEAAVLLSKSSPSAHKSLTQYLSSTFGITDTQPLQFPSAFIQSTLETYLSSVHTGLSNATPADATTRRGIDAEFKDVIGTVKVTVAFSAPVAPSLKALDVAVGSQMVLKSQSQSRRPSTLGNRDHDNRQHRQHSSSFMDLVARPIMERTGLNLLPRPHSHPPLDATTRASPTATSIRNENTDPDPGPARPASPMKITRISHGAYAIAVDHRLKFASRAVNAVSEVDGDVHDADDSGVGSRVRTRMRNKMNPVRAANEALLLAVVDEARRQGSEDG